MHFTKFSLCIIALLLVQPDVTNADFFEFMSNAMRFMSRVMGMEVSPENRESDPSRTAERIKALNDAAQFVSEARNKAGKRVLKNRIARLRSSMAAEGIDVDLGDSDSASSSSSDSDSALGSLLSDSSDSSTSSLLSESDSGTDLEALLQARSTLANRRSLNVALVRLLARKLKERNSKL